MGFGLRSGAGFSLLAGLQSRSLICLLLLARVALAQNAETLYRQAVDRQRAGDLARAVELYRGSLAQDAANFQARSNLGAALSGLGRYDEAIAEYREALTSAPAAFRPLLERNLALASYKSGRIAEAADMFSELHDADPANRDLALLAADSFVQLGDAPKAIELLRPFAAAAPDDKAAAYLLGIALLKSGSLDEAQRVLDPILKDTASAEGNFALGVAMFARQDYPAAVQALARAVQLNPALDRVYSYYGQALLFTGDAAGAADAFGTQLSRNANDFDANLRLAEILASKGRFAEAKPLVERAVRLRPDSQEAREALADTLAGRFRRGTAQAAGVPAGAPAPAIEVDRLEGGRLRLPGTSGPVVLVFGSYTCPQFRSAAPSLERIYAEFGKYARFLLIYVREAHSGAQWQSTINQRDGIALAPARTPAEKREHAQLCVRNLRLSLPAAVDGMDAVAEQAYAAWPSRVYVIGRDGRVRYSSGLSELEFDAAALTGAIRAAISGDPR